MRLALLAYAGRLPLGWGWVPVLLVVWAYYHWRAQGGGQWLGSRPAKWVGWMVVGVLVLFMTGLWLLFR